MSVTSSAASIDWQVIATGAGILIASIWATYQGLKKGKEKVESGTGNMTAIVGGTLMDNVTMKELTYALRENTQAVKEQTHILERSHDLLVIQIGRGIRGAESLKD